MKESATYQAILAEGKADGEREMLLRLARTKLGAPDAAARTALEAITDVAQLEAIADRVGSASTWAELLGSESRRRRRS